MDVVLCSRFVAVAVVVDVDEEDDEVFSTGEYTTGEEYEGMWVQEKKNA